MPSMLHTVRVPALLACLVGALAALGGTAATARAQVDALPGDLRGPDEPPLLVDDSAIVGARRPDGLKTGFIDTGEPTVAPGGSLGSRIIYLNNCKGETTSTGVPGCRITRASTNDSRTNRSTIASGNLLAYTGSDTTWASIVACVRETYAPFNVTVVDTDPGNVPHFEAMAAGRPTEIGFSNGVGGVAPFSCGIINNAITFSFANLSPNNVNQNCWTIAQETAHAFGLSHSMLASDPMTYIPNPPVKRFQNESACIGTSGCCQPQGECRCGDTMQNSYQRLLGIFGPATPTPPVVMIETPLPGVPVTPGFVVRANVMDDQGVASVELLVDGTSVTLLTTPPWAFNAPASITNGTHTVTVRATDINGTPGEATMQVLVGEACGSDAACAIFDPGLVCVDGRCVPGESTTGGLGTTCEGADECFSGLCATKDGENRCTESCDLAANACPDNYECLSNGAGGGLCWPSSGGCLGCSTRGGADPMLPIGAGLVLGALFLRRRRRPLA